MFEDDGTARTKLLSYLGFSVPTKEKDTVEDLSPELKALELDNTITEKVGYGDDKEVNVFPTDNGGDFFNKLLEILPLIQNNCNKNQMDLRRALTQHLMMLSKVL